MQNEEGKCVRAESRAKQMRASPPVSRVFLTTDNSQAAQRRSGKQQAPSIVNRFRSSSRTFAPSPAPFQTSDLRPSPHAFLTTACPEIAATGCVPKGTLTTEMESQSDPSMGEAHCIYQSEKGMLWP